MKKHSLYIVILLVLGCFASCELNEDPVSDATRQPIFGSITGLELYTTSFYNILPSASDAHQLDEMSDYMVRNTVPDFLREGAYGPQQSTQWKWDSIRNINYFIQNCNNPRVAESDRNHYLGIARFFRAYSYFEKVKRFGDVPWINKAMAIDDPDLYAKRDSRTLIMDSILADLDFAIEHIRTKEDKTSSLITQSVALAMKSRICLFEGTFRKYQTSYGLSSSADQWLRESIKASEELINSNMYKIYTANGEDKSYRNLFISRSPVSDEVILASVCDKSLSVLNNANWWWTSATFGIRSNLSRSFVHTYLNLDGTPFTNNANYKTMLFYDEMQNRDKRLAQSIRTPGYQRIDGNKPVDAPPVFSYSYTGYQPIKYCLDDVYYDSGANNDNSIPLIRYAEILLNYAEAKEELNELTDEIWSNTVGILRSRAGITGGLNTKPTTVDSYLQQTYFPETSSASMLEIRRERAIELVFEGLRLHDIIRWKKGNLMSMEWNGMYVPELDVAMDLDKNGKMDVLFTTKDVKPDDQIKGVTYINVAPMKGNVINPQVLKEGTKGEITWLNNIPRKWEEKHYLYPIPQMALIMNPNLKQNPGW